VGTFAGLRMLDRGNAVGVLRLSSRSACRALELTWDTPLDRRLIPTTAD
jgi:hypothetical protein